MKVGKAIQHHNFKNTSKGVAVAGAARAGTGAGASRSKSACGDGV